MAFVKAVEADPLKALYVLAIASGMRQGEILGVQWGDIDLKAGTLSVRRTLRCRKGQFSTDEPKTAKGRRMVELPGPAVEALQEHRVRALASGRMEFPWVFCESDGQPLNRHRLRTAFERLMKNAGLPEIRFHDLRHTSATLLLSAGTHPKVVQERLGHATIGITLDTYSHVLPGLQREASDKLGKMLSGEIGCTEAVNPGSKATGG